MNLLHISGKKDWGGGENQLLLTITELQKNQQINQFILCPFDSIISLKLKEQLPDIKILTAKKKINLDPRFIYAIFLIIKKERIDLIHVHDPDAHTLVVFASDIFRLKVKVILHKKTIFPIKDKKSSLYKYNHKSIKHIICVSEASKILVLEKTKHIPVSVIYDAIEVKEKTNDRIIDNDFFTILNVANHNRHKNLFTFLEIAHRCIYIEKLPFRFIQIGHGKLTNDLILKRDELNLKDFVEFKGFIENVDEFYKKSNVFLFTSVREGLGVSLLEAIIHQLPIVSSNVGGIPEVIEHKKNGLLCEYNDIEGYVENLKKIYYIPELSNELSQSALIKVKKQCSPKTMVEKLTTIYFQHEC
uniref:glycosyltransferase n=1 Tax=Flavobacterium sp. TaxID=239 RepID=UPI00404A8BB2